MSASFPIGPVFLCGQEMLPGTYSHTHGNGGSNVTGKRTTNGCDLVGLQILELRIKGGSINSISKDMHISTRQVRKILNLLNQQSRQELDNSILSSVPLQWRVSCETLRGIIHKANVILTESSDHRVQLQCLSTIMSAQESLNALIEDSRQIAAGISKIEASHKQVMITQSELRSDARELIQELREQKKTVPSASPTAPSETAEGDSKV
jgi:hypothetical protein